MKENILKLLKAARSWSSDMQDNEMPPFSIIQAMYNRISSKELLHSEIIAELLRPDGKHGCGDIFLREFMRTIGINPQQQDFSQVEVVSESPTDEGRRIDILIVWGDKAVIVENKLNNAVDQPNQLKDYLKDTQNKNKQVLKVVYIPLYAWRKTHENNLPADVEYLDPQKLSDYWLWPCVKKSTAAHDVALPYIHLLNYMNQSNRNYMKAQELYDILKQDTELMTTALSLAEMINNGGLKQFLRQQLLDMIKDRIEDKKFDYSIRTKTSELWLWYANYKYWVSIDVCDKYYLYLYFDDKTGKPEGENIKKESCRHDGSGYYYQLSENYRIGDDAETERLVTKVVELLEKSRK